MKKTLNYMILSLLTGSTVLLFNPFLVLAQETSTELSANSQAVSDEKDMLVIETEFGDDQMGETMPADKEEESSFVDRVSYEQLPKDTEALKRMKIELKEDQIIQANRSLKKVIEENQKLIEQNKELDRQLKNVRGQRNIEANRMNSISQERDSYKQKVQEIEAVKVNIEKNLVKLKAKQRQEEQSLQAKIESLEKQLAPIQGDAAYVVGMGVADVGEMKKKDNNYVQPESVVAVTQGGKDLVEMIEQLKREKEKLKTDEAKVHFNMGNSYFSRGEYPQAAVEYRKAIQLSPSDANAHFNLAFVSGDYLKDHKAAYTHYQQYLDLTPDAEDSDLVKEKIIEEELFLRSKIDSIIENEITRNEGFHAR